MSDTTIQREARTTHHTLERTGTVFSFTMVQEPPAEFADQAPYVLAMISLDDGPMITAQLTDLDEPVEIGDRVEMVTRKLTAEGAAGIIVYGYKFRKVLSRAQS